MSSFLGLNSYPIVAWCSIIVRLIYFAEISKTVIPALHCDLSNRQVGCLNQTSSIIHLHLCDPFLTGAVFHNAENMADLVRQYMNVFGLLCARHRTPDIVDDIFFNFIQILLIAERASSCDRTGYQFFFFNNRFSAGFTKFIQRC